MSELPKCVVQRSKWDRGIPEKASKSKHGELLNGEGTMCCLGFLARQCMGSEEGDIIGEAFPDLDWFEEQTDSDPQMDFFEPAAEINDNPLECGCHTSAQQEAKLIDLFRDQGFELSFID